jgi:glycosyltransferase involved in cell wall biosynthesis
MTDVLYVFRQIEPGPLREVERLASRLAARGFGTRILGVSGGLGHESVVEAPGLGSRWLRPWTARRLAESSEFALPALLHAVGPESAGIALDLAETWGRPYIVTIDEFPEPGTRLRFSRRWCRGVAVPCQDLADELAGAMGIPRAWLAVVPPELDHPGLAEPSESAGRVPVIGTTAVSPLNGGLATFFDAASRVLESPIDAEFVVAGPPRVETGLRRLADHFGLGERVTLADDQEDTHAFWRVLNIYCQPAARASAGQALCRAMAWSVPVIASDVPGVRSWVEPDQTGLLVPPDDPDALAAAIGGLLDSPSRRESLGRQGREAALRRCDPELRADCLASLYRQAITPEG